MNISKIFDCITYDLSISAFFVYDIISFFFKVSEIKSKSIAPVAAIKFLYQDFFKVLYIVLVLFPQ